MFLLILSVISIVIAMIRKGSFSNILDCGIRAWYLFVVALVAFLAVQVGDGMNIEFIQTYAKFFIMGAYALVLVGAIFNLSNLWMIPLLAGSLCNFVVIFMNGGKMPLSESAMRIAGITASAVGESSVMSVASSSTSLSILGGIIPIPLPGVLAQVISVGTVLIGIGLFFVIQNVLLGIVYEYEYEDDEDYDDEYDEYDENENVNTAPINIKSATTENKDGIDFIAIDEDDKDYTSNDDIVDEIKSVNQSVMDEIDDFVFDFDDTPADNSADSVSLDVAIPLFDEDEIVIEDEAPAIQTTNDDDIVFDFGVEDDIKVDESAEVAAADNDFENIFDDFTIEETQPELQPEIDTVDEVDFKISDVEEKEDDLVIPVDETEASETTFGDDFDFTIDTEEPNKEALPQDETESLQESEETDNIIPENIDNGLGDFELLSDFGDLFEEDSFDFDFDDAAEETEENSEAVVSQEIASEEEASLEAEESMVDDNQTEISDSESKFDIFDDIQPEDEIVSEVAAEESNEIVSENAEISEDIDIDDEIELSDDDDIEIDLSDIDFAIFLGDTVSEEDSKEEVIEEINDETESEEPADSVVKTMEDITDTDYTNDALLDVEFEDLSTQEEIDEVEKVEEPIEEEPVDVDSPFIIVNGRIVENPNYKFRKGIDYYETDRIVAVRAEEPKKDPEPVSDYGLELDNFDEQATVSELSQNGFEKVEMKIGDVQIKFWKRDND